MNRILVLALVLMLIFTMLVGMFVPFGASGASQERRSVKLSPRFGGYTFTRMPAFEQFTKEELSQLYMKNFNPKTADFTDEFTPEGVDKVLKLNVSSVGLKAVSTSNHIVLDKEFSYDGLIDVGGKTFNGDLRFSDYDGFIFWVGDYKGAIYLHMRRSPCAGPFAEGGDEQARQLLRDYGIGPYYRSTMIFPDENGYVRVPFAAFHKGGAWWEFEDFNKAIDTLNSIDVVFANQKVCVGTAVYLGDFRLYKLPPTERGLDSLIELAKQTYPNGEHDSDIALAQAALEGGEQSLISEYTEQFTLLLKPQLLGKIYANSYASLKERVMPDGYAPTSIGGLYDFMYIRDSSIQCRLHTLQGETDVSRSILKYILSVCRYIGEPRPRHIISDMQETAYGNNDGSTNIGGYSAVIKLGGNAVAEQQIHAEGETIVSVGTWLSRTDKAHGMIKAELKRGDTVVGTAEKKASELSGSRGFAVFDFGLPLNPVKSGDYTLTLSAPNAPEGSVIWYGRKNYRGLITKLNGAVLTCEASYEAFKTNVHYESDEAQPDTVLALAHAWLAYANAAPNTPEDRAFIEESYPIVVEFVRAFSDTGYISDELKLMRNPYLEHSRDVRKWNCYDMVTNSYASEVFHELAQFASARGEKSDAAEWERLAELIREGISENLVTELDGKRIYAELIDLDHDSELIKGLSWVNYSSLAVNWYGIDAQIMKNTFEVYYSRSIKYGGFDMLDACMNLKTGGLGSHVIGKGFSWELMYNASVGNTDRVNTMTDFVVINSPGTNIFPESWWQPNRFSDVGNQEHCSWIAYAMATVLPELKAYVPDVRGDFDGDGELTVTDALSALRMSVYPNEYYSAEKRKVDVDDDGTATVSDALFILRAAAGLA